MRSTPISLFALALALIAGHAWSQPDRDAFQLQPTLAPANQGFSLRALSYRYDCGVTYSHPSFNRQGNRIALRFAAHPKAGAVCPAIDRPYGPVFEAPALPAGRYDVHVTALAPCQAGDGPVCLLPEREERAGILTVGEAAEADWFIRPGQVAAGKAFDLAILSERYGNCRTSFSHRNLTVEDNRIVATFVTSTDTNLACVVDIHPHGPAFPVEALKAGRYPVDVIEAPACAYEKPICPWLPPDMAARTVDTLVVSGTTTLGSPSRGRYGRAGARLERGRVKVEGARPKNVQGRVLGEGKP